MNCLFHLFFTIPLYLIMGALAIAVMFFILPIVFFWYLIKFIINSIIGIFTKNTYHYSYQKPNFKIEKFTIPYKQKSNKYKNGKTIDVSYEEKVFNKEADLWGLSKEDRKIAKQERMSPADFIEAEERNDDVLDTDEF